MLRRLLFQMHLWIGLLSGLYILVVCITGAALVFRVDPQRARHPHLFTVTASGSLVEPVQVMEAVTQSYPDYRLSGVEAPTSRRPTYLAYVTKGNHFATVLIDPVTAKILGELPRDPLIETVQRLHGDLLGGRTGRTLNGIGATGILAMCATGLVIWWPGRKRWARGFIIDPSRARKRVVWELHRAVGIWTVAFLAMFAITALSFLFPSQFRAAVNAISPVTVTRAPLSGPRRTNDERPTWETLLARARHERPGQHVARVVLPASDRGAVLVMFSLNSPTPAGSELSSVYLDQYSGDVLATAHAQRRLGDSVMAWVAPLHIGGVGGEPLRWLWLVVGLAPALLVISGMLMWWTRVVRTRLNRY